ncbi:hypothetical protein Bca4012_003966 [Brassica carinata]
MWESSMVEWLDERSTPYVHFESTIFLVAFVRHESTRVLIAHRTNEESIPGFDM